MLTGGVLVVTMRRQVPNSEVADIFSRVANLLDIQGANTFRVRAYRNAAHVLESTSRSVAEMVDHHEDLEELPGIGRDLADKITEIVNTGRLPMLKELERKTPGSLMNLLRVPNLGPKRVKVLYESLGIKTLKQLKAAVHEGKVRKLPGFGEKTEKKILEEIQRIEGRATERVKYAKAEKVVARLVPYLEQAPGVKRVIVAGSFRRRLETVGDLDILVTCSKGPEAMEHFTRFPEVREVLEKGPTRAMVVLRSGLQVDVRVVPEESYGAALYYFTGSKAHTVAVRTMAVKKGLKINEYGVYRGEKRLGGKTEQEVFGLMGLPYIEPELRENRGEIEVALKGRLPKLIDLEEIRGDLHAHTTESDGRDSLEAMVEAAQAKGYEYLAITDHSKRLTIAHGLDEERLMKQIRAIDRLNEKLGGDFVVLKATEVDILENGELDLSDRILRHLDITVCSIHSRFGLSRDKQTERVIRAMDNPYFHILGHPTGRLIDVRDPYALDVESILTAAEERGCFVEINSQPERLDFNDLYARMAKDAGVRIAISSDAHNVGSLDFMQFGVNQARRGWIEADDVINTRSWKDLKAMLRRT